MSSNIVYRDYCVSDIDALVQLWKESRPGWPPGFFGASEITAASVAQEEKNSGKLFTVIAFLGERAVGYCRTSPYGGEPDASYVDLLNAAPDMHGRGIGKALLLDAVKRSAAAGLKRIDLHTWAANIKAVPLYKKTGFFWVPETTVYMQNYMPYLLGRKEFLGFLGGEDWYSCFERALVVESDTQKTESGREIFRYEFKRGDQCFAAEFDRKGRCLSSIEFPGFKAGLNVEPAPEFFVGRKYSVSLTGTGFNSGAVVSDSGDSLEVATVEECVFTAEPVALRVPKTIPDCIRVSVKEMDIELGIGIAGIEEVELQSNPVRFVSPGAGSLGIGLKKMAEVSSVQLSYSIDSGEFYSQVVSLDNSIYQRCFIDLPCMETGVHTLSVRLGESGYLETLVLICGVYCGEPVVIDTRKAAVIAGRDTALTVTRKGASCYLWGRGDGDNPQQLGMFMMLAGPPSIWNSDLPKQTYALELEQGSITARSAWPSRPGLVHGMSVSLNPAGYAEATGSVLNGSDTVQGVEFKVMQRVGFSMKQRNWLIPLAGGLMVEPGVENQIPDWDEDLSCLASGLGAPWLGIEGNGRGMMGYFPGWTELEYNAPGTPEADVAPGESLESPLFRMLCVNGSAKTLMLQAESLGWDTGNWRERIPFLKHDLEPVMAFGSSVSLSHPLHGERSGEIKACGESLCSGAIKAGVSIAGTLTGDGALDVALSVAGRDTLVPVYLVNPAGEVDIFTDEQGDLVLSSGRIEAKIDPGARGHVYSVLLDGVEYILSSHPEPSSFAWEKPWFGGILPSVNGMNGNPFPLQEHQPVVVEYEEFHRGVIEKGWQMSWKINHKKFGSLDVIWRVGLVPGVPLLKTRFSCTASSGDYFGGRINTRGFIQPGGSVEGGILTCEKMPGLSQGRNHAGAWASAGRWARVQRQSSFVEMYSTGDGTAIFEDYAGEGCHFQVDSAIDKRRTLETTWLFGAVEEDETAASVFRAHR